LNGQQEYHLLVFLLVRRHSNKELMSVFSFLQVVQEFGFEQEADEALLQLRTAARTYPDDPDFREIPLYVKYQRSRAGHLKIGSPIPDIVLMKLDGSRQRLRDLAQAARPLVLLAGERNEKSKWKERWSRCDNMGEGG
jgi:hypothetical protein